MPLCPMPDDDVEGGLLDVLSAPHPLGAPSAGPAPRADATWCGQPGPSGRARTARRTGSAAAAT